MQLSGSPWDFLFVFLGGIAVSLTPCVYPLIPVSAGYITASCQGQRRKGFILSLVYVTGMALAYSALGLFAVLTGNLFGSLSANPLVYLLVGIVIVFFGISMLGLFEFKARFFKLPELKQGSYLSTFLLGLFSALAITPCLTPVLGTILAYLTTKQNIAYGWLLLFCFSYGMGLIFIVFGTFGSLLSGLPKAGKWMVLIKKSCAWLIIVFGVYFIYTAIRRF
jgi:thiol:disulfide interchange protein DsbD